jgi:N-acyl-D-amino-acid deacylase
MVDYDTLIKNGTIIDGSGKPMFKASVGITDGKISEVGDVAGSTAEKVIDARHRFVTPGFIDCHSHSDWSVLVHPTGDSKIMQGVTTELNGLCGYAAAPIDRDEWWKLLYVRMTVGWSMHYAVAAYNWGPLPYGRQVEVDWSTMGEYLNRIEGMGVGLNYAMLFGHGALRYYVMGLEARRADEDDLDKMREMAEQCMVEGAFGMSVGLSGCPGCWADTDELVELCKVVKRHDGVYMPHMRSSYLTSSVSENLEIAEKSGVRTCLSHTRLNEESRRMVDDARAKGLDVAFDIIPYPGSIAGNIVYMLPHWLTRKRDEGFEWITKQLADPGVRERFVKVDYPKWRRMQVSVPGRPQERLEAGERMEPDWRGMQVQKVSTAKNQKYVGHTFEEVAKMRGVDPWTAWFDMIVEEKGYVRWLNFRGESYEDMYSRQFEELAKIPYVSIESDGPIESPRGVTVTSVDPRSYGTFPLVLSEYVRKRKTLSWEDAVMKMTSNPAHAIGLKDRGLLKEGYWADVTIFDPETVEHRANFKNCLEVSQGINHDIYPGGVEYTIVNGVTVMEKGKITGERPGHVLRNNKKRKC